MEKYIVLLILAVIVYYIHRYCVQTEVENFMKVREGFGDIAPVVSGVDDQNAINTLAQVAKKLQEGGLTVPGKLNFINSGLNSSSVQFDNDNMFRIKNKDGGQMLAIDSNGKTFFGPVGKDDGPISCGQLMVKNGSRFSGDRHYFTDAEGKGAIRVGAAWGIPGIYSEQGDIVLGSQSGNVLLKENVNVGGTLRVSNKPLVLTKVVAGGIAREIDTGVNHDEYPAIALAGFFSILDLEERDAGGFEFNTFKKDGRWFIFFNPRAQGNWHGGDNRIRARLTFFHNNIVQDDSKNWWGLHI